MIDLVDLGVEGEGDVVAQQLEPGVGQQVGHVRPRLRVEVVGGTGEEVRRRLRAVGGRSGCRATEAVALRAEIRPAVVTVPTVALDEVWGELVSDGARVIVKVDLQVGEHGAFADLRRHVRDVALIEVEMGSLQLYDDGSPLYDLLPRLTDEGFAAISVGSGFVDAAAGVGYLSGG